MATTGVVGQTWRADVTATGSIEPWDGSAELGWYVAADDRWHDPTTDAGVRHQRVGGSAVFETRVRIPGGDAVQRIWSVADNGGFTLIEVLNESALPIACVFTRPDVVANRRPADVAIEGIDVPSGSVLLPIGHRSSVVVALAHGPQRPSTLPAGLPSSEAVVRGWTARADAASRLDLPDAGVVEAVRAARCEVLLNGPADPADDPERYLLGLGEMVRMSELGDRDCQALADDVADGVSSVAAGDSPLAPAALTAAGLVLATAGERRALEDLAAILGGYDSSKPSMPEPVGDDIATVAAVERRIVWRGELFPDGIPSSWLGVDLEAHGLVAGPASRLSLALRWHGANAAVLWEVAGERVGLSTDVAIGGWSSTDDRGESLWVLEPQPVR